MLTCCKAPPADTFWTAASVDTKTWSSPPFSTRVVMVLAERIMNLWKVSI